MGTQTNTEQQVFQDAVRINKTLTVTDTISASVLRSSTIIVETLSSAVTQNNVTFVTSVSAPALSGTFYGDGSKLTGIVSGGGLDSTKLPLSGGTLTGVLSSNSNIYASTFFGSASGLSNVVSPYVKILGRDSNTIQGCIDLCTNANSVQNYSVLIPPGNYTENLTLKGSVHLIGLGGTNNSFGSKIIGTHIFPCSVAASNDSRINVQDIYFSSSSNTTPTITVSGLYVGYLRAVGCTFDGSTTVGSISTTENKRLYLDNCVFSTDNVTLQQLSAHTQIYSNNSTVYMFNTDMVNAGRCIDTSYNVLVNSYCAMDSLSAALLDGKTVSGLGLYPGQLVTASNITGSLGVITEIVDDTHFKFGGHTSLVPSLSSLVTFGAKPYVELHHSTLQSTFGTEVIKFRSGLLTCDNISISNSNLTGHGIVLSAGAVAGLVHSTFIISSSGAPYYAINGQAGSYLAMNSVSFSDSLLQAYNTSINPAITQTPYTAYTATIANGGTGATTAANALTNLGALPKTTFASASSTFALKTATLPLSGGTLTGGLTVMGTISSTGLISQAKNHVVVALTGIQTLPAASDTLIDFVAKDDPNSWYRPATKSVKPTVNGYYSAMLTTSWSPNLTSSAQVNIQIRKNANTIAISQATTPSTTGKNLTQMSHAVVFLSGNTDELTFTGYSGDGQNMYGDTAGTWTKAEVFKIS